jgi:N-acetylneuraminic acid mutarotase
MTFRFLHPLASGLAFWLSAGSAQAHFIFLLPGEKPTDEHAVQVYFSEDASPDDPALLQRITDLRVWQLTPGAEPVSLNAEHAGDELRIATQTAKAQSVVVAADDYGVMTRGDKTFRLMYYAKTGPAAGDAAWNNDTSKFLALDVAPRFDGEQVHLTVRFNGQPVSGAQVVVSGADVDLEAETKADGIVTFAAAKAGTYSLRVRHIEAVEGETDGKKFTETRHYSTVAFRKLAGSPSATPVPVSGTVRSIDGDAELAKLDRAYTSLGGATLEGSLYVYGGHTGAAHSYSNAEQGDAILKLGLDGQGQWERLAQGPALQGLALVAHGGKLYRIGGFTAKNAAGEDHDLWSQDSVAAFDPKTAQWTDLAPLPEPRSSFDAAVLGDHVYVIGGWQLRGKDAESIWHTTAWKLDLSRANAAWEPIPSPPFQRRALSVAAHQGNVYVIGGMQAEGGPCRRVDIFNPATGDWSQGAEIVGDKPLAGFGSSAFALGDRLYVSTMEGKLQCLSNDSQSWQVVRQLPTARFFHRMLPASERQLVMVGGANMEIGKFNTTELIAVSPAQE